MHFFVRVVSLLILISLAVETVSADVVHLDSGREIAGKITSAKGADRVVIQLGNGTTIGFDRTRVVRIEYGPSPVEVFGQRLEKLGPKAEVPELVELLVFAREHRLRKHASKVARRVLKIDPHHELARWTLGYVVFQNRWAREAELKKRDDLVRVDGQWFTKEERAQMARRARVERIARALELTASENDFVARYGQSELATEARRDLRAVAAVLTGYAGHRNRSLRFAAVRELVRMPTIAKWDPRRHASDADARRVFRVAMREDDPTVRLFLRGSNDVPGLLTWFAPRRCFLAALAASGSATAEREIERLAEILELSVQKAWVPELCRALRSEDRAVPAVREALKRSLGRDLGDDPAAWLAFWNDHAGNFSDR